MRTRARAEDKRALIPANPANAPAARATRAGPRRKRAGGRQSGRTGRHARRPDRLDRAPRPGRRRARARRGAARRGGRRARDDGRRRERGLADAYLSPSANGYYRRASDETSMPSRPVTAEELAANNAAEEAIQKKQWAEAAKAFERLFATYRESGISFYNYACCLARLGRGDDAVKALESAAAAGFHDAA